MPTTDQMKEWLSRYADAAREIALLRARADAIRDRAALPASSTLDGMPRAPGFGGDRIGEIVGTADALDREADEKEQVAAAVYEEIDAAIRRIDGKYGAVRRTVLQCRYLDLAEWRDIVFLFYGGKDDLSDKEESYARHLYKVHKDALRDLCEILNV